VSAYAAEPISPELVLVSPPEVAQLARARLADPPVIRHPVADRVWQPRALELLAVYAVSLLMTVGPLAFIVQSTP
jgi:hypothetical protein